MLDLYVKSADKRLRCGYTTGSCATMAAKGGAIMLLSGEKVNNVSIKTPKGINLLVDLEQIEIKENCVSCAVAKDAGDDFDVTDGMRIFAKVTKANCGIHIDGGEGIGRVTRPGLEQPVNSAAINSTPRKMITEELVAVCQQFGYAGGLNVEIFAPEGVNAAKKTFNGDLGILGGISILGTSGIVEPQSLQALIDTIDVQIKQLAFNKMQNIIITPGNYGEKFIRNQAEFENIPVVKCTNFIGDALKLSVKHGIKNVTLCGHIGKFVKLAGGCFNTHSQYGDNRAQIMLAHAALFGVDKTTASQLMNAATTDASIDILKENKIANYVINSIAEAILQKSNRLIDNKCNIKLVIFSNAHGLLYS